MKFNEFRYLILSDLYRIAGTDSPRAFLKHFFFGEAFTYNVWLRAARYVRGWGRPGFPLYALVWLLLRRAKFRYGISISEHTRIGPGFYIGHFGGIIVHPDAVIGRNCNISQGVTIGQSNRGARVGVPVIGDNVYIAPGAKIVGGVRIGNNVAIGANAVVIADVPDNSVAVGVPAKVHAGGSQGYVNRTDYDATN
ncbi:serine acetyltransferase [Luteimonas sp. MJ293]|uniref:serine O-acetyltransferase n=1 Tax=Luteimonas sp. MJ146 TaxID=3129240 RepID=UPI0031BBC59D